MNELDPPRARALRDELVRQVAQRTGASRRVLEVMARTPRHCFFPGEVPLENAYRDGPHPIGHGQTISQPTIVAMMTHALELTGRERVLEVGTGSGYQTAILSPLSREVYSLERLPELSHRAAAALKRLGLTNVRLRVSDGYAGWPEAAPFDRILLTAAPPDIPMGLLDQLTPGGFMVAPVGERFDQRLVRIERDGDRIRETFLTPVMFVPMLPGVQPED